MPDKMTIDSDRLLLMKLSNSNPDAMKVLYIRYAPQVKTFMRKFVPNISTDDVEDISQDVFLTIWEHRHSIPVMDNLGPYIYVMTRNSLFKNLRQKKVRHKFEQQSGNSDTVEPSLQIEAQNALEQIRKSYEELLTEQEKLIFGMHRDSGKTYSEIADELSISPKTVQYHISKVLAKLRQMIGVI